MWKLFFHVMCSTVADSWFVMKTTADCMLILLLSYLNSSLNRCFICKAWDMVMLPYLGLKRLPRYSWSWSQISYHLVFRSGMFYLLYFSCSLLELSIHENYLNHFSKSDFTGKKCRFSLSIFWWGSSKVSVWARFDRKFFSIPVVSVVVY